MGKTLIQQARGKGGPVYKTPSFRFKSDAKLIRPKHEIIQGKVVDFVKCQAHTAPLAEVQLSDGTTVMMIAPEGIRIGETISYGNTAEMKPGSVFQLKDIPEGTPIYNIESNFGDGGKFCRSSGSCARIITKTDKQAIVLLPSKQKRTFSLDCRACIGTPAGGGRLDKPLLKAGKMHHKKRMKNKRYPNPSAAAQNAVDHPFGNKRTARKAKQRPCSKNAPPGRKVGKLWPKQTGRKK